MKNLEIRHEMERIDGFLKDFLQKIKSTDDNPIDIELIKRILVYILEISSGFASAAAPFTEWKINVAKEKKELSEEDAESCQMWLRMMYSASDYYKSPGKENHDLLSKAAENIFGNQTLLFQYTQKHFPDFAKEIRGCFDSNEKTAVLSVVVEFLTNDLLELLKICMVDLELDQAEPLLRYIQNHDNAKYHAGYHVFRSLVNKNKQNQVLQELAPNIFKIFTKNFEYVEG